MLRITTWDIGKKIECFFEVLFVLSIILNSSTMYQVVDTFYLRGINDFTMGLLSMGLSCVLIIIYLLDGNTRLSKMQIFIIMGCVAFFVVYLCMTKFQVRYCVTGLFLPLELFTIQCCLKGAENVFKNYFYIYMKLTVLISTISLIFYFGGTVMGFIPGQQMRYMNLGHWNDGISYYNLAFVNPVQTQALFNQVFVRNVGIFMEAPGFAAPLTFSLFWELFAVPKRNRVEIVILLVTMVTTFSSKALIFGAALLFWDLVIKEKKTTLNKLLKIVIVPAAMLLIAVFYQYLFSSKLKSNSNLSSASIRLNDTFGALRTFLKYPLFGAGYCNFEEIYQNSPKNIMLKGNPTAGLLNILALGGAYMGVGLCLALSFYFQKLKQFKYPYTSIVFILLFLSFLFISSSQYSKFTLMVLAIGLSGFMYHSKKQITKNILLERLKKQKNAGNLYSGS